MAQAAAVELEFDILCSLHPFTLRGIAQERYYSVGILLLMPVFTGDLSGTWPLRGVCAGLM